MGRIGQAVRGAVVLAAVGVALGSCGGGSGESATDSAKATVADEWGPCLDAIDLDAGDPESTFMAGGSIIVVVSPSANFGVAKSEPGSGSFPADNSTRATVARAVEAGGDCPS